MYATMGLEKTVFNNSKGRRFLSFFNLVIFPKLSFRTLQFSVNSCAPFLQFDVCKHFTKGRISPRNALFTSICHQGKLNSWKHAHLVKIFGLRFRFCQGTISFAIWHSPQNSQVALSHHFLRAYNITQTLLLACDKNTQHSLRGLLNTLRNVRDGMFQTLSWLGSEKFQRARKKG